MCSLEDVLLSPIVTDKLSNKDLKHQLGTLFKKIFEDYDKWQQVQKRGVTLCTIIEKIKLQTFDQNNANSTMYPNDLLINCDKLNTIATIYKDIITNTQFNITAINALAKYLLAKPDMFKSININKCLQIIENLLSCYNDEYLIKLKVIENIAHSKNKHELILHSSVWEYPTFVNDNLAFSIKELLYIYNSNWKN